MRSFGTNTSFTATLVLPLPRRPMVCQSCNNVICSRHNLRVAINQFSRCRIVVPPFFCWHSMFPMPAKQFCLALKIRGNRGQNRRDSPFFVSVAVMAAPTIRLLSFTIDRAVPTRLPIRRILRESNSEQYSAAFLRINEQVFPSAVDARLSFAASSLAAG
jgi:hypothetical protein